MAGYTLEVKFDRRRIPRNIRAAEWLGPGLRKGFNRAGLYLGGLVKEKTPVDTGHARNSVTHLVSSDTIPGWLQVGSNVPYMRTLEEGSKPHLVPVEALERWAKRKRVNVWAVRAAIAKRGTKPHWMFRDAIEKGGSRAITLIRKAVDEAADAAL